MFGVCFQKVIHRLSIPVSGYPLLYGVNTTVFTPGQSNMRTFCECVFSDIAVVYNCVVE